MSMIRGGFLSAKERTALQAVIRHPSEIHGVARRANAILLLDDGWNCAKVAEALYLDDDTVRTWFKRYQAGGLDEMTVFDWKGRSGYLSRERLAELSARLGERLMRDSGEVAAYIAARWGVVYGPSGCVALLHRLGFEYKRPESLPARSDEARQAAFISRYDQLLNGLAADEVVYFADAVHPEYPSRPAHGRVRKGDKVALRRTSGRQRLNLHAALNLENFHCQVYTDDAKAYKGMDRPHETVRHSVGEYVRELAHTNGLESFWAPMKRGYQGVYHKMSPKHLQRYVDEFAGRHNYQPQDPIDQMSKLVAEMAGKQLHYADLIANNELPSGARS